MNQRKGDAIKYSTMGNVDRSYFKQNKLVFMFSHFFDIKS